MSRCQASSGNSSKNLSLSAGSIVSMIARFPQEDRNFAAVGTSVGDVGERTIMIIAVPGAPSHLASKRHVYLWALVK